MGIMSKKWGKSIFHLLPQNPDFAWFSLTAVLKCWLFKILLIELVDSEIQMTLTLFIIQRGGCYNMHVIQ